MACLVYHGGALGDYITTLPAIRTWRRLRSGGRLVLLGRPAHATLCPGLFDDAWDAGEARFASLFGGTPDRRLAPLLQVFDTALLFTPSSSALPAGLAALGVRAVVRQDPFPPEGGPAMHVVDWHLSLFAPGEVNERDRVPRIDLPAGPAAAVEPGTVALAPGSGSPSKNWPLPLWAALAGALADAGAPVAWIVGPAEQGLALPRGCTAWRDLPLPELAARLSRAAVYVGNDSGVSHLAAAAGCRCVVLFGPTSPALWAPRGRSVRVMQGECGVVGSISVGDVLAAVQDPC
jgi:hypothetical protein